MRGTWIMVANSAEARFYELEREGLKLVELHLSPAGPDHDPDRFARRLTERLERGRTRNEFSALVLAAEPTLHRRIEHYMGSRLKRSVRERIERDYTGLADADLFEQLRADL